MNNEKKQFNIGDLVVTTDCEEFCYQKGDVGIIIEVVDTLFMVDFNKKGNAVVEEDGKWYCCKEEINHYTPIKDLPLWKSNHMYLNDEQKDALRKLLHRVQWDEDYADKLRFVIDVKDVWNAFHWDESEEGYDFWQTIACQCDRQESNVDCEEEKETIEPKHKPTIVIQEGGKSSEYFLQRAIDLQKERGKEYDNGQERSMGKIVEVFNIITGKNISESEGWLFMQILKDVRQWTKPDYHADSAEDCVSYAALKAEALANGK